MVTAGVRSFSGKRLIGGLMISLELTGMSLFITTRTLMKFIPRLGVSLVLEAGMFWMNTYSVSISDGPSWSPVLGSS